MAAEVAHGLVKLRLRSMHAAVLEQRRAGRFRKRREIEHGRGRGPPAFDVFHRQPRRDEHEAAVRTAIGDAAQQDAHGGVFQLPFLRPRPMLQGLDAIENEQNAASFQRRGDGFGLRRRAGAGSLRSSFFSAQSRKRSADVARSLVPWL